MAPLTIQGDRELLYRAVENVLRNAVRFSPPAASWKSRSNARPSRR